jgi:ABC-type phosphate/phosphonate transport system substrate-binding protein
MIASLPMYDWPEVREATDAWWSGIARHLGSSASLTRSNCPSCDWKQADLLFSQTCGYPYTHEFKGALDLVATPHYDADGCNGPNYCSIIFAREKLPLDALRGARAAINTPDSMSGMLALRLVFPESSFFRDEMMTGGHLNSLAAVREGKADVCATDCVSAELARRYRPEALEGLAEIARSPKVPGLPYVTRGGNVAELRAALSLAFADQGLEDARRKLMLTGYSTLADDDYARILQLEAMVREQGSQPHDR